MEMPKWKIVNNNNDEEKNNLNNLLFSCYSLYITI